MGNFSTSPLTARAIDWYNSNKYRNYPFKENALFDIKDSLTKLPLDLLLDITLIDTRNKISSYDLKPVLKLQHINTSVDEPKMTFSYEVNPDNIIELDVPIKISSRSTPEIYAGKTQHVFENDLPIYIKFVTTSISENEFEQIKDGELLYKPEILDSKIIISKVSGVNSIIGTDGSVAAGDVHIERGCNTEVTLKNNKLDIRLRRGAGVGTCCKDTSSAQPDIDNIFNSCETAFLFFNGQTADINGNIDLTGGAGVNIQPANVTDYYKGIPTIDVTASPELLNIIGN